MCIRDRPDTDRIKRIVEERKPETAAVIGGGFIGLEMAENLQKAGIGVSVIEMQNQVMAPLDYELAELLHENMTMNGVELILGDGVVSFVARDDGSTLINLAGGRTIRAEMVLLSIGVKPNSALARAAGLKVNARGGIVTDRFLKTSDENIYAVGDCLLYTSRRGTEECRRRCRGGKDCGDRGRNRGKCK